MDIGEFQMDFFSLAGKKAVVTGGNTGLGQAFTLALAKAGADVFVPSMVDDDGTTGPLVAATGGRYEFLKIDITQPGSAALVVDTCVERFGSIDILVNSAGICPVAEVLNSPALRHYITRENVPPEQMRALHHDRIYLGAGGCHEAFAKSVYASGTGKVSRVYAKFANGVRQRLKAISG